MILAAKKKVYLSEPIDPSAFERLKKHVELVDSFEHPEELDAIILRQQYCTGEVIRKATRCKLIQQHGVGVDRIDTEAAKEAGIPVKNTPGCNARSVAEYAITMMLALSRKVVEIDKKTRAGEIPCFGMPETVGIELSGKKLGIIGSGNIAHEVLQIARDGFHMQVFCHNPHRSPEEIRALGFEPVADIKELFGSCDYISLHCPLTADSYHMINAEILRAANPQLILINAARGGIIDEAALYDALVEKRIAAAGLDVFEQQPPSTENPLLKLDNLLAGMHVAGSTNEALKRIGNTVVDNVFAALEIEE